MARRGTIIAVHSFRGGTGKSNLVANLAALWGMAGQRVAVIDTDIYSPGIHVLFGLQEAGFDKALNDYLFGRCTIQEVAYPAGQIGTQPGQQKLADKAVWLIPSSIRPGEITSVLKSGYDVNLLNQGFRRLIKTLDLDCLLIDTHPGINEETLLAIAISDILVIMMRPDQQDFQGTAVTVDLARRLAVQDMRLVLNKALLARYDAETLRQQVEEIYGIAVAGVLPLSEDVADLSSNDLFVLAHPDHPWTDLVRRVAAQVVNHSV